MAITTSSSTATPTPTATTAVKTSPGGGIANSLGLGSGVDTTALVKSLVEAQFAGKTAQLNKRSDALTAQISSLSEVKSGITGFASALTTLVKNGTLATQLTSSSSMVKAAALPGARVSGTTGTIAVTRLATAQVAVMRNPVPTGASIGTGTLQLRLGSIDADGNFAANGTTIPPITIGAADSTSLQGIADKFNAAGAGVTASVVSDSTGDRLVFKGATGAAQAFTLTATGDSSSPNFGQLSVGFGNDTTGARVASRAGNAEFSVDGVEMSRDSNVVTGAITGVRLELTGVTGGAPATIGTTPPTEALTQAVNDFVSTYNDFLGVLNKATDPVTGTLRSDSATMALKRSFTQLTLTPLTTATDKSPKTLAEIGVATNRDGTLRVDTALLATSLNQNPAAVEAMFIAGTGASGRGLSGALNAISLAAINNTTGLGATADRYTKAQSALALEKTKLDSDTEAVSTRMTQQFSASEARVAAYKAQQTFMENQIKMWAKDS